MIMTTAELRQHVTTREEDQALELRLQALEASIRKHTNNNFKRALEENGGEWPPDIKMGVVKLIEYDLSGAAEKAGIASEALARHTVTYEAGTAENRPMGYPVELVAFLKPYMRARFGQRSAFR